MASVSLFDDVLRLFSLQTATHCWSELGQSCIFSQFLTFYPKLRIIFFILKEKYINIWVFELQKASCRIELRAKFFTKKFLVTYQRGLKFCKKVLSSRCLSCLECVTSLSLSGVTFYFLFVTFSERFGDFMLKALNIGWVSLTGSQMSRIIFLGCQKCKWLLIHMFENWQ